MKTEKTSHEQVVLPADEARRILFARAADIIRPPSGAARPSSKKTQVKAVDPGA